MLCLSITFLWFFFKEAISCVLVVMCLARASGLLSRGFYCMVIKNVEKDSKQVTAQLIVHVVVPSHTCCQSLSLNFQRGERAMWCMPRVSCLVALRLWRISVVRLFLKFQTPRHYFAKAAPFTGLFWETVSTQGGRSIHNIYMSFHMFQPCSLVIARVVSIFSRGCMLLVNDVHLT
jgi:hypothetical protein